MLLLPKLLLKASEIDAKRLYIFKEEIRKEKLKEKEKYHSFFCQLVGKDFKSLILSFNGSA